MADDYQKEVKGTTMSEDVFTDMLEDDESAASDTPRTDPYTGTHETHRINGRNIYDHARELERELNAARAYSVELTAKYLEASGEIQAERSELRARVAELELNLMRATMIVERAMEKTSLGWTIPGFVEQFKRLLAKKA
jgi:hypothetical protein